MKEEGAVVRSTGSAFSKCGYKGRALWGRVGSRKVTKERGGEREREREREKEPGGRWESEAAGES